jgi:hypothetical protein
MMKRVLGLCLPLILALGAGCTAKTKSVESRATASAASKTEHEIVVPEELAEPSCKRTGGLCKGWSFGVCCPGYHCVGAWAIRPGACEP